MKIDLTAEQEAWLTARVAEGEFPSLEAAVRQILDDRITEDQDQLDLEDLDWTAPFLEEARAAAERGEVMTLDEYKAHNRARRASIKD